MTVYDQREDRFNATRDAQSAPAESQTWLVVDSAPQVAALRYLVKPDVFVSTWREAVTARQFDRIVVLMSLLSGSKEEQGAKYDWKHTVAMTRLTPQGSLMRTGGAL